MGFKNIKHIKHASVFHTLIVKMKFWQICSLQTRQGIKMAKQPLYVSMFDQHLRVLLLSDEGDPSKVIAAAERVLDLEFKGQQEEGGPQGKKKKRRHSKAKPKSDKNESKA